MPPRKKAPTEAPVTVRVPATSANLGPGFDCLGLALNWFNQVTVAPAGRWSVSIRGEGAQTISRGRDNIIVTALEAVYHQAERSAPPGFHLRCLNRIPLARGLGSSAAAVVAGLVAGNALMGEPLSREDLLQLAAQIEGHADNAAPALFGGCQMVLQQEGKWMHCALPLARPLTAVLFIPDFEIPTSQARAVLPERVALRDAVFNLSRVAWLVAGLATGELTHLRYATRDRLHQPYRLTLFPAMEALFQAALDAGAYGAFLSGAGSTILALSPGGRTGRAIGQALAGAAQRVGLSGKIRLARPSFQGAEVISRG